MKIWGRDGDAPERRYFEHIDVFVLACNKRPTRIRTFHRLLASSRARKNEFVDGVLRLVELRYKCRFEPATGRCGDRQESVRLVQHRSAVTSGAYAGIVRTDGHVLKKAATAFFRR